MRLVVDASIAVKWSVIEQDSDLAAKLIESDHELIAPELLAVEVANALTSAWRRRTIDGEHADNAIARLPAIIGTFAPDASLVADALILSRLLRHPVYDCMYLALAWRASARVVSLDARFRIAVANAGWDAFLVSLAEVVD